MNKLAPEDFKIYAAGWLFNGIKISKKICYIIIEKM